MRYICIPFPLILGVKVVYIYIYIYIYVYSYNYNSIHVLFFYIGLPIHPPDKKRYTNVATWPFLHT